MEEGAVFITKLDPFFSGFLVPEHFFLKKGCGYILVATLFQG
jgi:hypothetical protein